MLHLENEYLVDAPDGVYPVRIHSLDYRAERETLNPKDFATPELYMEARLGRFRDYISTESVRVKAGKANLGDVYNAASDLLEQTGYWGKFIESLRYEHGHLEMDIGS